MTLPKNTDVHPPGWPGMPARSQEHDTSPDGTAPGNDAQVTEAQRELEKKRGDREAPQRPSSPPRREGAGLRR